VYNIYNKSSKIYYLFDENNNQIVDCIFDFDYDPNHRNIVFTGNEINSSDQMSSEIFIYNIGSGNVKKIVDDEHNDIYSTFFNNSGENVYYLQESWYSKFYHQLNVINLMTMELQGISENVNILRICKNSNIAYGRKMEFYRERDFPYRIEYKDIYLDMNNNTIQYYTDEEEVCIDGYKVPVKKGFLEKENVFIYLSPDKTKAIYLKEGEFIKLILF